MRSVARRARRSPSDPRDRLGPEGSLCGVSSSTASRTSETSRVGQTGARTRASGSAHPLHGRGVHPRPHRRVESHLLPPDVSGPVSHLADARHPSSPRHRHSGWLMSLLIRAVVPGETTATKRGALSRPWDRSSTVATGLAPASRTFRAISGFRSSGDGSRSRRPGRAGRTTRGPRARCPAPPRGRRPRRRSARSG